MASNYRYILGLDAGNTVIKAVLFDLDGRQVAAQTLDGQSSTPQPGFVERDLNELWSNARQVIARCLGQAGVRAEQIVGVGCAGHGNGLYLLDREDAPLIGIQSLDSRATALAGDLAQAAGDRFHALCLQKPWPSQTPTLLAWVKQNRPDLYERVGTVLLCKDFITFKLTGERVSDVSDMSGCGFVKMPEGICDDSLLELYGIPEARDFMPRIVESAEIAGRVSGEASEATGLVSGTPVIGGYFDVVSSALGSGVVRHGEASIIVGTWGINQVFSAEPVHNPSVFMASRFAKNRFVNIEASATSAANLEWYVRNFVERDEHHDDPFGYCNECIAKIAPALDDPVFHPYLHGSGQGAEFRAGFYGLAGWHGEGHLLRALFEGVVFEHRRHVDVLRGADISIDRAILSGGGARSPIWPQMFADCLGIPISVAEAQETGALGAAIGVSVAIGEAASYEQGVQRMTRQKESFEPDAGMARHYEARNEMFVNLIQAMRETWRALDRIQSGDFQ